LRVSADLRRQFVSRFCSVDEVGDPELGEAGDSAGDVSAVHQLEYAGVCRGGWAVGGHLWFTLF
jgi:hypothetical protein